MNFVFVLAQRVSKIARSIFGFQKGGSAIETKSVKKNEIPQKGQFNIMVGYNQQNVLAKKSEVKNTYGFAGKIFISGVELYNPTITKGFSFEINSDR